MCEYSVLDVFDNITKNIMNIKKYALNDFDLELFVMGLFFKKGHELCWYTF
jgi:hypothetical protein